MPQDTYINELLIKHLKGGEAFMPVQNALEEIEFHRLGERPQDLPYSFYEIFYHMWFTQRDILDYCRKADYSAPEWPKEYWPECTAPENPQVWEDLKSSFFEDREKLISVIKNAENGVLTPVPSNEKHTLLRETLLVIEHSAYHNGQLLILLRHLGLHSS